MRLIGNKTRLLDQIEGFLLERGVVGGTLLDVFAGTASVARHFRARGFKVRSNDLLMSSYVRQRTYVGLGRVPDLDGVLSERAVARFLRSRKGGAALEQVKAGPLPVRQVLAYLQGGLKPVNGLIARQYAEGGPGGRLYFSSDNGARIDAVHEQLRRWRAAGRLDDDAFYLLLTALLEAADRVANISGTYGAFLKQLQRSAREPLQLRPPELALGQPAGRAYHGDANQLARRLRVDTLYIDPPYNQRQYAKNYHVMEVLAELHQVDDLAGYEAEIYGKTGLLALDDRISDYCRRNSRGARRNAAEAFTDLVRHAKAEHIVISYSEEGILTREEIGQALAAAAGQARFDYAHDHEEISYKRFRSDKNASARRAYRVLAGRKRDEVQEWLFYVHKPAEARSGKTRRAG